MRSLYFIAVALFLVCWADEPVMHFNYTWSEFAGKTVFITGGSSGMGLATGILFARVGARVVICSRNLKPNWYDGEQISVAHSEDDAVVSLGGYIRWRRCDVSDKASFANALDSTIQQDGFPTVFLNAAGQVGFVGDMDDMEDELMGDHDAFHSNGYGLLVSNALEVERITKREQENPTPRDGDAEPYKIINIGSLDGYHGTAAAPLYATSKHAVWMVTKCASEENTQLIRVNGIAPGFVNTSLVWQQVKIFEYGNQTYDEPYITPNSPVFLKYLDKFSGIQPSGSFDQPEDVGHLVMWLASDASKGINGRMFEIDGGSGTV